MSGRSQTGTGRAPGTGAPPGAVRFRAGSGTAPRALATAVAAELRRGRRVEIDAMGVPATAAVAKALAITTGLTAPGGLRPVFSATFVDAVAGAPPPDRTGSPRTDPDRSGSVGTSPGRSRTGGSRAGTRDATLRSVLRFTVEAVPTPAGTPGPGS